MNSNIKNKSKDEIYKIIAAKLLQEVLNEDLSTIVNRDRILDIFNRISSQEKENKNYFLVHTNLQNNLDNEQSFQNGDLIIDILMKNNEKLYNEINQKVRSEFLFDIELHKYGRTYNRITPRWAYIIYPDIFGTTAQSFLNKNNLEKKRNKQIEFKNKNFSLEKMRNITIQQYEKTLKDYKTDSKKNPVRILIEFIDIHKNDRITQMYLYFENLQNAKQTYDLLMLMRMKFLSKKNPQLLENLNSITKYIEPAHKFILMKKIIFVKNQIIAKNSLLEQKERILNNHGILLNEKKKNQIKNPHKYTLGSKFNVLLSNFKKKEDNIFTKFNSLSTFKKAKQLLTKIFLNGLKIKNPEKYLYSNPAAYIHNIDKNVSERDKKITFKIKRHFMDGVILRNKNVSNKNDSNLGNFFIQNLAGIKNIDINNKKDLIYFGNDANNFITKEEILEINSVYLNLNENGIFEENCILINGPKKELNKFLTYKFNDKFLKENDINENNNSFIEPESHGLRIEQSFPNKFIPLIIQIFHISINIPTDYINYLQKINSDFDFNNYNNNYDLLKESSYRLLDINSETNHLRESNNFSLKLLNPNDFYFYISLVINGKFYARTKLARASAFDNDFLFVEFNNQISLNQEQIFLIKNFQMKISVNIIPVNCFEKDNIDIDLKNVLKNELQTSSRSNLNRINDLLFSEFNLENFIEHMKPHEIAYCYIDHESLKSKKNEFTLKNNFAEIDSKDNYIVLNIFPLNQPVENNQLTKFITKDYSIGQDIYHLIEYSKEDFTRILNNPDIPENLKEKYYNVEFDDEDYFILRPHIKDQKEFMKEFSKEINEEKDEKIIKIYKNSKYKYLPKCEVFTSNENLSKSTNMYLNKKLVSISNITDKNLIYRLKNIFKYSLCKILAIGSSNNLILKDLFLGKIFSINNLDLIKHNPKIPSDNITDNSSKQKSNLNADQILIKLNSFTSNDNELSEKIYFKLLQENPISIYDFIDIDLNNTKNAFNHNWKILLKFNNKLEMEAFLFYLKDIRRKSIFDFKKKNIIDCPVNQKLLLSSINKMRNEYEKLNILIEKIEFKKNLKITGGARKLRLFLFKGNQFTIDNSEIDKHNRFILELLDNQSSTKYKNSLIKIPEIKKENEFFKEIQNTRIEMPSSFEYDSESLAKANNQILFEKNNIGNEYKLFQIRVKTNRDNLITIQTLFSLNDNSILSMQELYNFFCEADLSNVINGENNSDFIRMPLFSVIDKSIIGMIDFKVWLSKDQDESNNSTKEMQFKSLFDKRFSDINQIKKVVFDPYGNEYPIAMLNPNLFKRKIIRIIFDKTNLDIESIAKKLLNENDVACKNELIECLYNKGVLGYEYFKNGDSTNRNNWMQIIPDQEFLGVKTIQKFYVKLKKRYFYDIYRNEEWRKFFTKSDFIKDSAYGQLKETSLFKLNTGIKCYFLEKDNLIKEKKENSEKYFQVRKFIEIGVPKDVRLEVWDSLLNLEKLCFITIEELRKRENDKSILGLTDKKEVFEYFLEKVIDNKDFNINFSFIDNDINYLFRDDFSNTSLDQTSNQNTVLNMEIINKRNLILKRVKNITKSYFLWTNLNINISDENTKDKKSKKYIYFFGMLKLIKTLLTVFKSDYIVFWMIIGFSQVIELFYQSNPLISNQINYSKIYIMITKVF